MQAHRLSSSVCSLLLHVLPRDLKFRGFLEGPISNKCLFSFPPSGLNSILFAINIDNTDLNGGPTRGGSSVTHLLKESTQGIGSLWKESTQGVSSLLREISTATAVVPGFTPRVDGASDPLPVLPRSTSAGREAGLLVWCFQSSL